MSQPSHKNYMSKKNQIKGSNMNAYTSNILGPYKVTIGEAQ